MATEVVDTEGNGGILQFSGLLADAQTMVLHTGTTSLSVGDIVLHTHTAERGSGTNMSAPVAGAHPTTGIYWSITNTSTLGGEISAGWVSLGFMRDGNGNRQSTGVFGKVLTGSDILSGNPTFRATLTANNSGNGDQKTQCRLVVVRGNTDSGLLARIATMSKTTGTGVGNSGTANNDSTNASAPAGGTSDEVFWDRPSDTSEYNSTADGMDNALVVHVTSWRRQSVDIVPTTVNISRTGYASISQVSIPYPLAANHITISPDTGQITNRALSGSGTVFEGGISAVVQGHQVVTFFRKYASFSVLDAGWAAPAAEAEPNAWGFVLSGRNNGFASVSVIIPEAAPTASIEERAVTDSKSVSDSVAGELEVARGLVGSATALDALSHSKELGEALQDLLTVSDALSHKLEVARSLSDTFSASDSVAYEKTGLLEEALSDAATLSDALSRELEALRSQSASCSLTDLVAYEKTGLLEEALSDAVTYSDLASRELEALRGQSESYSLSDSASYEKTGQLEEALSDAATLSDSLSRELETLRSQSGSCSLSDSVAYEKTGLLEAALSESFTLLDALSRELEALRSQSESYSLTDLASYEKTGQLEEALSDVVTLSDALSRELETSGTGLGIYRLTDSVAYEKTGQLEAALSEFFTLSDVLSRELETLRSQSESYSLTDLAAYEKTGQLEAALSDAATLSDSLSRELEASGTGLGIYRLSDSVAYEKTLEEALSEFFTLSDVLSRELETSGTSLGSYSLIDSVAYEKTGQLEGVLGETFTLSDSLSRELETSGTSLGIYRLTDSVTTALGRSSVAEASVSVLDTVVYELVPGAVTYNEADFDSASTVDSVAYEHLELHTAVAAAVMESSDDIAREVEYGRLLSGHYALSDALSYNVNVVEEHHVSPRVTTLSDSLQREVELSRALEGDFALINDALSSSVELARVLGEIATSGDSVAFELELLRAVAGSSSSSDAAAYLAQTPSGGTKVFGAIDIVVLGYATEVGSESESRLVNASVAITIGFTLQNHVGPLVENTEGPGNLVANHAIGISAVAHATPSKGIVIAVLGGGEHTGVGRGVSVGVPAGGGVGVGQDPLNGDPWDIDLPILVPVTGGISAGSEGGAGWNPPEVVIDGVGTIDGVINARWLDQSATIDGIGSVTSSLLTNGELMSVEEIWNTALVQLGVTTVGGTGDQSPQATLLYAVWNGGFRTKFLSDHTWNGGKRTAKLVKYVDNPTGLRWNYAFTLPSDYIRAYRVNGKENVGNSSNAASVGSSGGHNLWEVEVVADSAGTLARCLLTDESELYLEYIFDVGDANIDLLSPMTKWAMGLALAAHAAPNFGKSPSDIQMIEAKAQEALVAAKGIDGQEGSPQMFQSTSLLDCRY